MTTQVLEGTLSEVQQRLGDLPIRPDESVRVVVTQVRPSIEHPAAGVPFHPTELRNGVPLLPRRQVEEPVDLDLVRCLLDLEDLELLDADRAAGRQRLAGDDGPRSQQP